MPIVAATYNVLASAYIKPEWYPFTPPELLDSKHRLAALTKRLIELEADLLCLQEVDRETFDVVRRSLTQLGYAGALAMKGQGRPDGCSIFVRATALTLHRTRRFEYDDVVGGRPASGHVAQLAVLDLGGRRLGVANTHLKWDPPTAARETRYGYRQMAQLLEAREKLAPECDGWVVCGDLNATSDSDVVAALLRAGFRPTHNGSAGAATCNSNGQAKMIDFLFYDQALAAEPLVLPRVEDDTPLPGPDQPSDHVAVVARLAWKKGGGG